MMAPERAEQPRLWHEEAYQEERASLPIRMRFMGLDLQIDEDVFALHPDEGGPDPSTKPYLIGRAMASGP